MVRKNEVVLMWHRQLATLGDSHFVTSQTSLAVGSCWESSKDVIRQIGVQDHESV